MYCYTAGAQAFSFLTKTCKDLNMSMSKHKGKDTVRISLILYLTAWGKTQGDPEI